MGNPITLGRRLHRHTRCNRVVVSYSPNSVIRLFCDYMSDRKIVRGRICPSCKVGIPDTVRSNRKYCSERCAKEATANPYTSPYRRDGIELPTGTTGTISELRVAADLLIKGYETFRSLSPHCSCDLAIIKDGILKRIEVRTGYVHGSTGKRSTNRPASSEKFDILAICYADKIDYEPSL